MDQTPASYKDRMDQVLDQVLKTSSQQEAQDRFDDFREELAEEASSALEVLEDGFFEATAILALPGKYRRRLRTTNMLERFIEEIRRREKVVYPHLPESRVGLSARRGPLRRDPCAETHEEWSTGRRYLNPGGYFRWRADLAVEDSSDEEALLNGKRATQPTAVPA